MNNRPNQNNSLFKICIIGFMLLFAFQLQAQQQYPVKVQVQVNNPSIFLADYQDISTLSVQVALEDMTKQNYDVRLYAYISIGNVKLSTLQPLELTLQGGIIYYLSDEDLKILFGLQNMSGLSQIENNGSNYILPEGSCILSFSVEDANVTGLFVSNKYTDLAHFIIQRFESPLLNLPANGSVVDYQGGMNPILFSWTPRGIMTMPGRQIFYELQLAQIYEGQGSAEDAIASGNFILQEKELPYPSFMYDQSQFVLEEGVSYAWRIRAYEKIETENGIEENSARFSNNGLSEVYSFSIQENCGSVQPIQAPMFKNDPLTGKPVLELVWNGDMYHEEYQVSYRPYGSDLPWTVETCFENSLTIGENIIEAGMEYEYTVSAKCKNWTPAEYGGTFEINASDCEAPYPIQIVENNKTKILLNWEQSKGATAYKVHLNNADNDTIYSNIGNSEIELPPLETGTYTVSVNAVCSGKIAEGLSFEIESNETGLAGPCLAQQPLRVDVTRTDNGMETSANVQWAENDMYESYVFSYWHIDSMDQKQVVPIVDPMLSIDNIITDELYQYEIKFNCPKDKSALSEITTFRLSDDDVPVHRDEPTANCFPPAVLSAEARDETVAHFYWDKVSDAEEYQLEYAPKTSGRAKIFTTTANNAKLKELLDDSVYTYRVRCRCGGAYSIYSERGEVNLNWNTKNENCDSVPKVWVNKATETELQLAWTYEDFRSGYTVFYKEESQVWDSAYTLDLKEIETLKSDNLRGDTILYTIDGLKPSTAYYFKMQGWCGSEKSQTNVPVKGKTKALIIGGDCTSSQACDRSSQIPIDSVTVADTIMVSDYTMVITKSERIGTSQLYKGNGMAQVPMMGMSDDVYFQVTFDSLFVNDLACVVTGNIVVDSMYAQILPVELQEKIQSTMEKITEVTSSVKKAVEQGKTFTNVAKEYLTVGAEYFQAGTKYGGVNNGGLGEDVVADATISKGDIDVTDDGKGVVVNGKAYPVSEFPALVKSEDGKVFQVNSKGNVEEVGYYDTTLAGANLITPEQMEISFAEHDDSRWDFDPFNDRYAERALMEPHYISFGKYYASAKAILKGETDPVLIDDHGVPIDSVIFVNRQGFVFNKNDRKKTVTLVGGQVGDAQEVFAVKKNGDDINVVGILHLASYPRVERTVKIIPIRGASVSSGLIKDMADKLNATYGGIGFNFTVELDESMLSAPWCGMPECNTFTYTSSTTTGNNYKGDEGSIVDYYTSLPEFTADDKTSYIFAIGQPVQLAEHSDESDEGEEELQGKMYRGKQFGFMYNMNGSANKDRTARVLAHEIGHGNFNFYHIFLSMYLGDDARHSDNIMSYSTNASHVAMNKVQWDIAHDPGVVWGVFERDKDAQSSGTAQVETVNTHIGFNNNKGDVVQFGPLMVTFNEEPEARKDEKTGTCNYSVSSVDFTLAFEDIAIGVYSINVEGASISYSLDCETGDLISAKFDYKPANEIVIDDIGVLDAVLSNLSFNMNRRGESQGGMALKVKMDSAKKVNSLVEVQAGAEGTMSFAFKYGQRFSGSFTFDDVHNVAIDFVKDDKLISQLTNGTLSKVGVLTGEVKQTTEIVYSLGEINYTLNDLNADLAVNFGTLDVDYNSLSGTIGIQNLPLAENIRATLSLSDSSVVAQMHEGIKLSFYGMTLSSDSILLVLNDELFFQKIEGADVEAQYSSNTTYGLFEGTMQLHDFAYSTEGLERLLGSGELGVGDALKVSLSNGVLDTAQKAIKLNAAFVAQNENNGLNIDANEVVIKEDGSMEFNAVDLDLQYTYGPFSLQFHSKLVRGGKNSADATVQLIMSNGVSGVDTLRFEQEVEYQVDNNNELSYFKIKSGKNFPAGSICGMAAEVQKFEVEYAMEGAGRFLNGDFKFGAELEEDINIKDFAYIDKGVNGSFNYLFSYSATTGFNGAFDFSGLKGIDIALDFNNDIITDFDLNDCDVASDGTFTGRLEADEIKYTRGEIGLTLSDIESDISFNLNTNSILFNSISGEVSISGLPGSNGQAIDFILSSKDNGLVATVKAEKGLAFYGCYLAAENLTVVLDETFGFKEISGDNIIAEYERTIAEVAIKGNISLSELLISENELKKISGNGYFNYGNTGIKISDITYDLELAELMLSASVDISTAPLEGNLTVNEARIHSNGDFSIASISMDMMFQKGPLTIELQSDPVDGEDGLQSAKAKVLIDVKENGKVKRTSFEASAQFKREGGEFSYIMIDYPEINKTFGDIYGISTTLNSAKIEYDVRDGKNYFHGDVAFTVDLKEDKSIKDYAIIRKELSGDMIYTFQMDNNEVTNTFDLSKLENLTVDLDFNKDGNKELSLTNCSISEQGIFNGEIQQGTTFTYSMGSMNYSVSNLYSKFSVNLNTNEFDYSKLKGTVSLDGIPGMGKPLVLNLSQNETEIVAALGQNAQLTFYGFDLSAKYIKVTFNDELSLQSIYGKDFTATYENGSVSGEITFNELDIQKGEIQKINGSGFFTHNTYGQLNITNALYENMSGDIVFNIDIDMNTTALKGNMAVSDARIKRNGSFEIGQVSMDMVATFGPVVIEFEKAPQPTKNRDKMQQMSAKVTLDLNDGSGSKKASFEVVVDYIKSKENDWEYVKISKPDCNISLGEIYGIESSITSIELSMDRRASLHLSFADALTGKVALSAELKKDKKLMKNVILKAGLKGDVAFVLERDSLGAKTGSFDLSSLQGLEVQYISKGKAVALLKGSFDKEGWIRGQLQLKEKLDINVGNFKSQLDELSLTAQYNIYSSDFSILEGSGQYTILQIPGVDGQLQLAVSYKDATYVISANTNDTKLSACGLSMEINTIQATLTDDFDLTQLVASGSITHNSFDAYLDLDTLVIKEYELETIKFSGAVDFKGFLFKLSNAEYKSGDVTVGAEVRIGDNYVGVKEFIFKNDGSIIIDSAYAHLEIATVEIDLGASYRKNYFQGQFGLHFTKNFGLNGMMALGSNPCNASNCADSVYNFGFFALGADATIPLLPPVISLSHIEGGFGYNFNMPKGSQNIYDGKAEYGTYVGYMNFGLNIAKLVDAKVDAHVLVKDEQTTVGLGVGVAFPADIEDPYVKGKLDLTMVFPSMDFYGKLDASVKVPASGSLVNFKARLDVAITDNLHKYEINVDTCALLSFLSFKGNFTMQTAFDDNGNEIVRNSYSQINGSASFGFNWAFGDTLWGASASASLGMNFLMEVENLRFGSSDVDDAAFKTKFNAYGSYDIDIPLFSIKNSGSISVDAGASAIKKGHELTLDANFNLMLSCGKDISQYAEKKGLTGAQEKEALCGGSDVYCFDAHYNKVYDLRKVN